MTKQILDIATLSTVKKRQYQINRLSVVRNEKKQYTFDELKATYDRLICSKCSREITPTDQTETIEYYTNTHSNTDYSETFHTGCKHIKS